MRKQKKINKICYVLKGFPVLSQTFVSDEIASMIDLGVVPLVLVLKKGDFTLVQPSAKKILDSKFVSFIEPVSRYQSLRALFYCFFMKPGPVFRCFFKSLFSKERWLYFQVVPYAKIILKKKVQFIHAHFADINLHWAKVLSDWTGIPFGMTTHGYDLRQDPLTIPFAKRLFADADLVVTISEFNKKFMKKKYQLSSEKIKIIHCGIELARFSNTKCNLKFKEKKLKILNVGRLVPVKGHDILLNALAIVRKRGINFDLTIIGGGPLEEDLLQLTKQLCLEDCVHFIGAQSQKSVIEEMCNSDLFVLSSRSEGLPVVCMETMAMGAFIIAPRINGIPELVENKINGLLVEPDNVEALAEAITWADNNREEVKVMCVSARSKVEKEFDRKKCTEDLLRLMERC